MTTRTTVLLCVFGVALMAYVAFGGVQGCMNGSALSNAPIFKGISEVNGGGDGGGRGSDGLTGPPPGKISPF